MVITNQLIIGVRNISFSVNIKTEENEYVNQIKTKEDLEGTEEHELIIETPEEVLLEHIDEDIWQIEIPKIELIAPIQDGTDVNTLNSYVGHFEETQNIDGNIGLAGHNRGYPVNYFQRLKELEIGDTIIYKYYGNKKTYIVDVITVIQDTDWSYLENTEDNRITLITCVENTPNVRRCIQGIESNIN